MHIEISLVIERIIVVDARNKSIERIVRGLPIVMEPNFDARRIANGVGSFNGSSFMLIELGTIVLEV